MNFRPLALAWAMAVAATPALAQAPAREPAAPYRAGQIEVAQPWIRATPNGAATAAAYFTLVNRGHTPDRLVSARSVLARQAQIHQMSMVGGVMRMREVSGGVAVAPGQVTSLLPGGPHLMLIGLAHAFRAGEKVPVTLTFARSGSVTAEFDVREDAPAPAPMR